MPLPGQQEYPNMSGRLPDQVDKQFSRTRPHAVASRKVDSPLHHYSMNTISGMTGDTEHDPHTQPLRGFGLLTGVPKAPNTLIDDFNRETYTIMASDAGTEQFWPTMMPRSPTLTLTQDTAVEAGDFFFYGSFEEEPIYSPAMDSSSFSRTALGIPSSQPLSRSESQTSSRLQDDAASLAPSHASAGGDLRLPRDTTIFTPSTSFSRDHVPVSAMMPFCSSSPADHSSWNDNGFDLATHTTSPPIMDYSTSIDVELPFSANSTDHSHIPRSVPRRAPQQSALSQSLQGMTNSQVPGLSQFSPVPDSCFELDLRAGEEALSASFAYMDSQMSDTGPVPYLEPAEFSQISVTPADAMDTVAVDDSFGNSPTSHQLYEFSTDFHSASHSFPAPDLTTSEEYLAVPSVNQRRNQRRRAFSTNSPRPITIPSGPRTHMSTKPIPIPTRSRQVRGPLPRSLPGSVPQNSRGRRKGPMEDAARQGARKTRNEKTICIRCKGSKQGCHRPEDQPDAPCDKCEKIANGPKRPGPCTKAYFEDLVLRGSLNQQYNRTFTHLTMNRRARVQKELDRELDYDQLLHVLERARRSFNLRVYHGEKPAYGLNLDSFYGYLKNIKEQLLSREESESDFAGFIDKDLVHVDNKTDDWASTLTEAAYSPREKIMELYLVISSMPEHATFYYVSKPKSGEAIQERMINPENPAEDGFLQLAARLARIIYRKVEISAMAHLQKEMLDVLVNQGAQYQNYQLVAFLHRLGSVLVSLRASIAHSSSASVVPRAPPQDQSAFECRVTELCRVLFFYYHVFRRRLPHVLEGPWEDTLKGTWSRDVPSEPLISSFTLSHVYSSDSPALISGGFGGAGRAAAPGVWNMFPLMGTESMDGFESWMALAGSGNMAFQ